MMIRSLLALLLCASAAPPGAPVILVLGDSLSAAYGIDRADGWVALLEKRLRAAGHEHQLVNASISGETTRAARARIPDLLQRSQPALVIVELGGNDGLRGVAPSETRNNLRAIIQAIQNRNADVLLVGIRLPPNYGSVYADRFAASYTDLAAELELPLVPFLLEGVANQPQLMQDDGIHPTAEAQPTLLERVWSELAPML
jgi:acyl-CoA thioesterase-1